jgi:hypothetical protein
MEENFFSLLDMERAMKRKGKVRAKFDLHFFERISQVASTSLK